MAKEFAWLARDFRPNALIDIGANDGAYASFLRDYFRIPLVHAFEPLQQHAAELSERGFIVHPVALSDRNGEADFHVNDYGAASSLLPLTETCIREYPQTARTTSRKVTVARLDDELPDPPQGSLVKIDAQGYELPIIQGGRKVLTAAQFILIEMTFVPLYEGQALFNGVHAELDALGFEMAGFLSQRAEADSGRPLFAHCAYAKRPA